jgi:hypothetical protein
MPPDPSIDPGLRASVEARLTAWRNGEDPDLSGLLEILWSSLYARVPGLTGSLQKEDQHRILEGFLVDLGFPRCPDLQYLAGPVLWYAREKGVIPPARAEGESESWTLDERKYRAAAATLAEGQATYGDWMRDALRAILSEQH